MENKTIDDGTLAKLNYITRDMIEDKTRFDKYFATDGHYYVIYLMEPRNYSFVRVGAKELNEFFRANNGDYILNYVVYSISKHEFAGMRDGDIIVDCIPRTKVFLDTTLYDYDSFMYVLGKSGFELA